MPIKVIGLTGPSGAGKSSVCRVAKKENIPFIDADKVYHSLLTAGSDCTQALVLEFGNGILDSNGAPDTKRLAAIVFSSEEKLTRLNSLVLHFVIEKLRLMISELEASSEKCVIVDAPTLIESGFHKECDIVVSVIAPRTDRIGRICARDGISIENAEKRVVSQHPDEFYITHSDIVIINDADEDALEEKTRDLIDRILV